MEIDNIVDMFEKMTDAQMVPYFTEEEIETIKLAIKVVNVDGNCEGGGCDCCFLSKEETVTCTLLKALQGAKYYLKTMYDRMQAGPIIKSITVDCTIVQDFPEPKQKLVKEKTKEEKELDELAIAYQNATRKLHSMINSKVTMVNNLKDAVVTINVNGKPLEFTIPDKLYKEIHDKLVSKLDIIKSDTERELFNILNYSRTASAESVLAVYGPKEEAPNDN